MIDYKLSASAGAISINDLYYGLSLELLTFLLVARANGEALTGQPVVPAAAFHAQLLRHLEDVSHPSDAITPDDPRFHLRPKQRGVLDVGFLAALDSAVKAGETSAGLCVRLKKDGEVANARSSDAFNAGEFAALLDMAEGRITRIADQVLTGRIDVRPYRIGNRSPCAACAYRAVCRFEPQIDGYRHLPPRDRSAVFESIMGGSADAE